ncbi:MAG: TetR/AcrR family transcriptional regulator [Lachnospiraceae bacterium]|nr:TetR/AcrR family transcriptional regulator [Lachnospiraceae bacterium]MEE3461447.1 TetR/AcrR family transcriptional regulator [Lachnospiraceae bacterium]
MNRRELLTLELREDIGQAILDMMKEKPLEKITVDDFSEKANVGRATFYRQFHSKEEAISYKLNRSLAHFAEKRGYTFKGTASKEFSKAFFEFIYSIRETNSLLIENGCEHCIFDAMRLTFENMNEQTNKKEYYHDHFRAYGLLGLVEGWIDADYDLAIDEMANLAVDYFYKV